MELEAQVERVKVSVAIWSCYAGYLNNVNQSTLLGVVCRCLHSRSNQERVAEGATRALT